MPKRGKHPRRRRRNLKASDESMTAPRDPNLARLRLVQMFNDLPHLDFKEGESGDLQYAFPRLKKPKIRKHRLRDRALNPKLPDALRATFKHLLDGTDKLKYGTSDSDWRRYMRFPSERLVSLRENKFQYVIESSGKSEAINADAQTANNWFRNILIPLLQTGDQPQVYVVGGPGSGKSTLLKFLINTNNTFLRDERIIFTRFEYLKFDKSWYTNNTTLKDALAEYLSFIMLRDALYFYGYSKTNHGGYIKLPSGRLDDARLLALLDRAKNDLKVAGVSYLNWFAEIRDLMLNDSINIDRLRNLPHVVRIILLTHLDENNTSINKPLRSIFCLVMDGLDCIAIEDFELDSRKYSVLRHVMGTRQTLTNFSHPTLPNRFVRAVPVFVMRENTYELFNQDRAVEFGRCIVFRVDPIDAEVSIHNALKRATDLWALGNSISDDKKIETATLMVRVVVMILRLLNSTIRAGAVRKGAYDIIGPNIRTLFEIIHKIVILFIDSGIENGVLKLHEIRSPYEIIQILSSRDGRALIRQKKYRLIELLLFSYVPWFENAICYCSNDDGDDDDIGNDRRRSLEDNPDYTGVIDNIFNYTTERHENDPDRHCLLEKIRIVQSIIATQNDLSHPIGSEVTNLSEVIYPSEDEILETMSRRTGYRPRNPKRSLHVLMRTEIISAHVSGNGRRGYEVTPLGRALVGGLCRDMSYIEHVFHETLLPRSMVEDICDDRRQVDVDKWTVSSIRNLFIWLTYLRFVEQNDAGGVRVWSAFRLWDDTYARVMKSIGRILKPNIDHDKKLNQDAMIRSAYDEIELLLTRWRRKGLIRE